MYPIQRTLYITLITFCALLPFHNSYSNPAAFNEWLSIYDGTPSEYRATLNGLAVYHDKLFTTGTNNSTSYIYEFNGDLLRPAWLAPTSLGSNNSATEVNVGSPKLSVIDDNLYLYGGKCNDTCTGYVSLHQFDSQTGEHTWKQYPTTGLPNSVHNTPIEKIVDLNGHLIALFLNQNNPVHIYNESTQSWSSVSEQLSTEYYGDVITYHHKLYMCLNNNNAGTVYVYDPSDKSLKEINGNLPPGTWRKFTVANDKLYIAGVNYSSRISIAVYNGDEAAPKWDEINDGLPSGKYFFNIEDLITDNNILYAYGYQQEQDHTWKRSHFVYTWSDKEHTWHAVGNNINIPDAIPFKSTNLIVYQKAVFAGASLFSSYDHYDNVLNAHLIDSITLKQ